MKNHDYYTCPDDCTGCLFCEGWLGWCDTCKCGGASLPTECPGEPVSEEHQDAIKAGTLDFKNGNWEIDEYHTLPQTCSCGGNIYEHAESCPELRR